MPLDQPRRDPFCALGGQVDGPRGRSWLPGRLVRCALVLPVCLALLTACASTSLPTGTPKPRAERPTYSVGERWIRNDGVYDLIRIEPDLYVFSARPNVQVHLTRNLGLARVEKGQYFSEFSPPLEPTWPLEVGKFGSHTSRWRHEGMPGGFPARFSWSVDAHEEVEVTAGKFWAFRIQFSLETPGGRRFEFTVWYAPEAEQFVKASSENFGIVKFHLVTLGRRDHYEPLQVILDEPRDQARISMEDFRVLGKVTIGRTRLIKWVSATLNGEEISTTDERGSNRREVPVDLRLKLREGKNVLIITAVDSRRETVQEARTLFYDKPAPPAPAPIAAAPPPAAKPAPAPVMPPPAPAKPAEPEPPRVAPAPAPPPTVIAKPAPPSVPAPAVPPAAPLPVAALPPLQVTVSSPKDQTRVEHESVGLAGLVSGGKGVSRVQVTLNGVEVSRLEERVPRPALAVNLPLKLREGQNTLVVTATESDGKIYQEVRTVHYEKLVPLTVAFRYPEDRSRVGEEASVVAAVVTSSKGVAKVRVLLNGKEVHEQSERAPQPSLLVTVPVTLREGPNVLAVSASEPDGTIRQEVRTIVYEKPKEVAAAVPPPPPPPPTHDRWAVVVGVGRYESPDIPRLRYTVPDAEAIYDVLTGPGGFKKEHVLLLTDKTDKKPTYRNLKWALGTFLARSAKKDDTVLIFFAGHGAPEVDQRGVERDGFSKYLVPSDAEPDDLYSTALPMDELQTIFGRIEAERVVVFLDACYSGAAGGRTFASKKTRSGHVDEAFLERLARSKGRAIVTASRPAELSIELQELGHGIFTYYLVQGLKGAADLNRDGIVTLQELYEYVEQQVTQKSRAVGGNQHPVMKGELEGVLPLMKVK